MSEPTPASDPAPASGPASASTPASGTSGGLFGYLGGPPGDAEWLRALVDVEAALVRSQADVGLVPADAAEVVAARCVPEGFDAADLGRRAAGSASLVVPLVAELTERVPADMRRYVHLGATSQDVLDTALSLVAARAIEAIDADLSGCGEALAALAGKHRDAPQLGRTLLQQAMPTTFGLVCAAWLVGLDEAAADLRAARRRLAVQYGGPVGTLAGLDGHGPAIAERMAGRLGLVAPILPWHTTRNRVAGLAAALGTVAGALGTVALDVTLLSQNEVGEVAEGEPGGSSAMPHKRNPARAVQISACTHRVPGLVASVLAGMPQAHQRSAGRWQAEPVTVTELLSAVGAAARHARVMLPTLRIDPDRMSVNLAASAVPTGNPGSTGDPGSASDVGPAPHVGPAGDLGSAGDLVDRALRAHRAAP